MTTHGDPKVFFILVPLFLALCIYLIIYNKKKAAFLKKFSTSRGLQYRPKDNGRLEDDLSSKLEIKEPGYVRTVFGIKDIIRYDSIRIFRCTELLDLDRYGTPQNTHFHRLALTFDLPEEVSLFFLFDPKRREYRQPGPQKINLEGNRTFQAVKSCLGEMPPPYPLSVTFSRGLVFLYLEPLMVGGEQEKDVEYLLELGKKLKRALK